MSTTEQLQLRAYRVLNDGRRHSMRTFNWARSMLGAPEKPYPLPEAAPRFGFTLRELSLGATNFDVEVR